MKGSIFLVADTHLRGKNLQRGLDALSQVYSHAKEGDIVIFAGDFFDHYNVATKEAPLGTVIRQVRSFLAQQKKVSTFILAGNHDLPPTGPSALEALASIERVHIVSDASSIEGKDDWVKIIMVPWPRNPDEASLFYEKVEGFLDLPPQAPTMIVGHLEIEGYFLGGHTLRGNVPVSLLQEWTKRAIVRLGHVHARSDYYIGALFQHNFGEEGNPQGFERWSLGEDGSLVGEFIPVDVPEYKTVDVETYEKNPPSTPFVRVIGEAPPEKLDPSHIFVRQETIQRRVSVEDSLEGLSLPELIVKWAEATGRKVPVGADYLASLQTVEVPKLGSLLRWNSLLVRNVGPHGKEASEITLGDGLTILVGPNGSGKTFLVESLFAALYGRFPSRGRVTSYTEGGGSLAVSLETDEGKFIITRSGNQATLYKADGTVLASKIKDVEAWAELHVGSPEVMLATAFLSQTGRGDLLLLSPAERKDLMASLLGLSSFDSLEAEFLQRRKEYQADCDRMEAELSALKERLSPVEEREVLKAEGRVQQLSSKVEEYQRKLNAILRKIGKMEAVSRERLEADLEEAREGLCSCNADIEKIKMEIEKVGEVKTSSPEIRREMQTVQSNIIFLEKEIEHAKEQASLISQAACDPVIETCPLLSSAIEARDSLEEKTAKLEELRKEVRKLEKSLASAEEAEERLSSLNKSLAQAEMQRDYYLNRISSLEEQLSRLQDLGDVDLNQLVRERESLAGLIADAQKDLAVAQEKLGELKYAWEYYQKSVKRIAELKKQVDLLKQEVEVNSFLAEACGKNGVRQLLLDQAFSDLQVILDDLVQQANIPLRVVLKTVRESKSSGKEQEVLDILVAPSSVGDYVDASACSGGEQKMVRLLLRLALLKYLKLHRGMHYNVLMVDELFDALDYDNMERLLSLLSQGDFSQVIVVTHSPSFPNVPHTLLEVRS